jgi:hypothetical protein
MGKLMDLVYNSWTIAGLWSMVDSTMASEVSSPKLGFEAIFGRGALCEWLQRERRVGGCSSETRAGDMVGDFDRQRRRCGSGALSSVPFYRLEAGGRQSRRWPTVVMEFQCSGRFLFGERSIEEEPIGQRRFWKRKRGGTLFRFQARRRVASTVSVGGWPSG